MSLEDTFGNDTQKPIHITDLVIEEEPPERLRPFDAERDLPPEVKASFERIYREITEKKSTDQGTDITLDTKFAPLAKEMRLFGSRPLPQGSQSYMINTFSFVSTNEYEDQTDPPKKTITALAAAKSFVSDASPEFQTWFRLNANTYSFLTESEHTRTLEFTNDWQYLQDLKWLYPEIKIQSKEFQGQSEEELRNTILQDSSIMPNNPVTYEWLATFRLLTDDAISLELSKWEWEHMLRAILPFVGGMRPYPKNAYDYFASLSILSADHLDIIDDHLVLSDTPKQQLKTTPSLPVMKKY